MAFDFTGMNKAWGGGIKPRLLGYVRSDDSAGDDLGHATWKDQEILDNDPRYQAYQDQIWQQSKENQLKQDAAREASNAAWRKEYEDWKSQQVLKNAMDSNFTQGLTQNSINADDQIAAKLKDAAMKAFAQGNASAGLDLLGKANNMTKSVADAKAADLRMQSAKTDRIGEIMSGVNDQSTLDQAKLELSKLGYVIPEQYSQYNDDTSKWLTSQAGMSKKVQAMEKLDLQTQKLKFEQEARQKDQELAKLKEERIARNQASAQEARDRGYMTARPAGEKEVKLLIKEMSGNDQFDDLSVEDKLNAAKDLDYIARGNMATNPSLTYDQARAQAKEEIYNRIKDKKYSSFASPAQPTTQAAPAGAPSYQDWIAKARAANPNVSEEQLKQYYQNKYAK